MVLSRRGTSSSVNSGAAPSTPKQLSDSKDGADHPSKTSARSVKDMINIYSVIENKENRHSSFVGKVDHDTPHVSRSSTHVRRSGQFAVPYTPILREVMRDFNDEMGRLSAVVRNLRRGFERFEDLGPVVVSSSASTTSSVRRLSDIDGSTVERVEAVVRE